MSHKVNPDPPQPGRSSRANRGPAATRRAGKAWRPTPAPLLELPGRRARCTPSPPRSASRTPCCRAAPHVISPRRPRPPAAPVRHQPARRLLRRRRRRYCRELDGLLLRAAACLAESREPRRLVPGSHRCSPRPGPGSRTAGGGDGGRGGNLIRGLGLGNCLRLHGQFGAGTGVGWKSWGEVRDAGRGRSRGTRSGRGVRRRWFRTGVEEADRVRVCKRERERDPE